MKDLFGNIIETPQKKYGVTPTEILEYAIDYYQPIKVLLLFSGGHDSLVSSHKSATVLEGLEFNFTVYHGDTTIGITETQQFVKDVCKKFNWPLEIRKPPKIKDRYEAIVREYGFPGPTRESHQFMYRRLKERALKAFITHECKSSPYARENVLLVSGVRKAESAIRMGYKDPVQKQASAIWCNPVFYWSDRDCRDYMRQHNLPENPVKNNICISGECLCGAFGGREELEEIRYFYPEAAKEIDRLHDIAKENGHEWPWSMGPTSWADAHPEGVGELPFMCVGCEEKRLIGQE